MPKSRRPQAVAILLMAGLAPVEIGCKKNTVAIPVLTVPASDSGVAPKPVPAAPPPQEPAPPLPTAPTATAPTTTQPPVTPPPTPPAEESAPKPNPPRQAARPPATAPANSQPADKPVPADPPVLGDVLPLEQQKQLNTAIDQSLAHAQSSLGALANRQLTQDQQRTVTEVQNFIQQAQTRRKSDLNAAKSLAERADVLASDLVRRLR